MASRKEKKEGRKSLTVETLLNPEEMERVFRDQAVKLRSKFRKVVTGDEKKRIRDRIRETQDEPRYVKFFDKVAFTVGVLNMGVCQYFLLNRPDLFPYWYAAIIPLILASRYFYFRSSNNQYFMIDFCYFTIFCTMVNLWLIRDSALFFKTVFICATGPLTLAIPVWRNSFVFHDYDKIVSVYIHILPSMLYYTLRHNNSSLDIFRQAIPGDVCGSANCDRLYLTDYLLAVLLYMFWQFIYLYKTEFLDKSRLDSDPSLMTSLRWLAQDTKNAAARFFLKMFRLIGVFSKEEDYDSRTMKTKIVFVVAQLIFTLVSFLPTPLMYHYSGFHLTWILFIVTSAVFNGGSFYIEVFSKRYNSHIAKIEEMHRIAQAASTAMSGLATLKSNSSAQSMTPVTNNSPVPRSNAPATGLTSGASSTSTNADFCNSTSQSSDAGGRARATSASSSAQEATDAASAQATSEELEKLAEMLQHTKDSAWLQMKEHFQRADELRGLYTPGASRNTAEELMLMHSPGAGEEDYVVCDNTDADRERFLSQSSEDTMRDSLLSGLAQELGEDNLEEDIDPEIERELLSRERENSVLSIDR
uniref:Glycerophosphocholine acyltransferase 1 n=1 Tax=Spumella elongata TaxID=89044 RepID=A0A7S3MDK0_9STRA|mmetsp:Transcript_57854/g.101680  ORF Transcript_57854/g.101680 Transcript_57854/m.101680 type:complete len:586 (+) Transcript_57854:71-1828(+)